MSKAEATHTSKSAPSTTTSAMVLQRKCACGGSAGLSGECEGCKTKKLLGQPLQKKLAISQPGDEFEQEVDRAAEQVMRMPPGDLGKQQPAVIKYPMVQRRVSGSGTDLAEAPAIVHDVVNSPGRVIETNVRRQMELRFGQDFSEVRIHADALAADSAEAVSAKAYTVGSNLVFGQGCFAPDTYEGKQLLAHELVHVIQQERGGPSIRFASDTSHEHEARQASIAIMANMNPIMVTGRTGIGIARAEYEDQEVNRAVEDPLKELQGPVKHPASAQKALSPEELIEQHVFGPRVHEEIGDLRERLRKAEDRLNDAPSDQKMKDRVDQLRNQLSSLEKLPVEPTAKGGGNVPGHGRINTRAAIQIVDKDGNLIALERGSWRENMHAEEDAIAKLRARLGNKRLPAGSRVMVAGNQVVCSETDHCRPALKKFVEDYGADRNVESFVRRRPTMSGNGLASGKTTERTALRRESAKGEIPPAQIAKETIETTKVPALAPNKANSATQSPAIKPPSTGLPKQSTSLPKPNTSIHTDTTTPSAPKLATSSDSTPKDGPKPGVTPKDEIKLGGTKLKSPGSKMTSGLKYMGHAALGTGMSMLAAYLKQKIDEAKFKNDMTNFVLPDAQKVLQNKHDETMRSFVAAPGEPVFANISFTTKIQHDKSPEPHTIIHTYIYWDTRFLGLVVSRSNTTSSVHTKGDWEAFGTTRFEYTTTTYSEQLESPPLEEIVDYAVANNLDTTSLRRFLLDKIVQAEAGRATSSGDDPGTTRNHMADLLGRLP